MGEGDWPAVSPALPPKWRAQAVLFLLSCVRSRFGGPVSPQADESVADMRQYARETLAKLDETMRDWNVKRQELSLRLAVMDAADDPELQRMAEEVADRVESGGGFPDARPAEDVLAEAHRRYVR